MSRLGTSTSKAKGMAGAASIRYSVHHCTSSCPEFPPESILENKPTDAKSRWLSQGNQFPQFLILKLERLAVVKHITFGKYEKTHACNLRKFHVSGGLDCDRLELLLEAGLHNNSEMETFPLKHTVKGHSFPCQYIKIAPLQAWGHSFNFSIWYVELQGETGERAVQAAVSHFQEYRECEAMRLCLKHLRQFDCTEAFDALQKRARVQLEHPLLTRLHSKLVREGDFQAAERIVEQSTEEGYLDSYISGQPVEAHWSAIQHCPSAKGGSTLRPGMRGGHQMCLDAASEVLYLHGGWDGSKDLSDLWSFDLRKLQWTCLCQDTALVGGPSARSCHKMSLDVESRVLYTLGRYLDPNTRSFLAGESHVLPGDFYSYSLDSDSWSLISQDTYVDGGPQMIYDHQMTFDPTTQTLYVFGGRVLSIDIASISDTSMRFTYSGLYAYHCTDRQWSCLRPDFSGGPYPHTLVPRMAHSMLLHPGRRQLFVMGGQREKQPLSDMVIYDLRSDETTLVADGKDTHIPASGFTMRTTIDPERNEIYLLTGLNKFEEGGEGLGEEAQNSANSLWLYSISADKWSLMFQGSRGVWQQAHSSLPAPRYAHQFVLDPTHQLHYMFGGNPGDGSHKTHRNMRLDDFWKLKLIRLSKEKLLRHCQLAIRKQKFSELARVDPTRALTHLKTSISAIVNHDDPEESAEFRSLAATVFAPSAPSVATDDSGHSSQISRQRNKLYDELASYLPQDMAQPPASIMDMIQL